jgi:uncharacterized protein YggE
MNRKLWFLAGMALLPLALMAAVCGGETTNIESGEREKGITVAGEGRVTAAPDLALLTLGVSTLAPTVAEARQQAADALDAMIVSMRDNGIEEKDIQTQNLSIYPEYDFRGETQTLRGFRVQNTVVAKIRDLDRTTEILDEAVAAGGDNTQVQGISFTIDDPSALQAQARADAVEDARLKAETLAEAGGVSLGDPVTIDETGSYSPPIPYAADTAARESAAGGATPIEPGELDVVISVTVTFNLD